MVRLAQALYAVGLSSRAVLSRCYGVDFPEELFVVTDAGPLKRHLSVYFASQPWLLAIPPERNGPWPVPNWLEEVEQRIFGRDPDLMPLALLFGSETRYGDDILCYRLTELRSHHTTIFRIGSMADPEDEVVRYGDSLLEALHTHQTEHLRKLEWRSKQPWNRGAGSVDREEVTQARAAVEVVEELRRRLASPAGD
jgi:hypothetical protein